MTKGKLSKKIIKAISNYDSFRMSVHNAERRGVFYYKGMTEDDKMEKGIADRVAIMKMGGCQLELLSEATTAMSRLLDNGASIEDLDRWKEEWRF